ncbi:hypothetical protein QZH41_013804 [Actinostola sp. cb2023]|nr:hypothetical protein QZH41_013804 [Actinostola sp. cb2023]
MDDDMNSGGILTIVRQTLGESADGNFFGKRNKIYDENRETNDYSIEIDIDEPIIVGTHWYSMCTNVPRWHFIAGEKWVYSNFLKSKLIHELMPKSSKIVVFDTRLNYCMFCVSNDVFMSIFSTGVRSAPVFDSLRQDFVGMLTISDFINILRRYYKSPLVRAIVDSMTVKLQSRFYCIQVQMDELEEHKIETWREIQSLNTGHPKLVRISPIQSLYDAVKMLLEFKIHRLPVIDNATDNALCIVTHKRILKFLFCHIKELPIPDFMKSSLQDVGIGTYSDVATVVNEFFPFFSKVTPNTPLITVLHLFAEKRISAVPVVDENGVVVDIYAKFDVINLAAEKSYNNLDVTVQQALSHRAEGFEGVHRCYLDESMLTIIERLVEAKVHRLVVVDYDDHCIGVLSLSDILRFIILKPTVMDRVFSLAYGPRA